MMKITKLKGSNRRTGCCRLGIAGDMTIYTAQELKDDLLAHGDEYQAFELDLTEVNEIDTAGVQVLLLAQRAAEQAGKTFAISECSETAREVLDLYRLQAVFAPADSAVTG